MVTITNMFSYLQNGTFYSCEICHGLWENHELSCDTKISKNWKKKKKKIRLGSSQFIFSLLDVFRDASHYAQNFLKCLENFLKKYIFPFFHTRSNFLKSRQFLQNFLKSGNFLKTGISVYWKVSRTGQQKVLFPYWLEHVFSSKLVVVPLSPLGKLQASLSMWAEQIGVASRSLS